MQFAEQQGTDQTAHLRSLISVIVVSYIYCACYIISYKMIASVCNWTG